MFIDMHMHEKTFSPDSFLSLEEMVTTSKNRGLDGICITDHDSIGLKEYAEQYSKETGFPIFVGVEYYSLEGDIVAFGIDKLPDGRINAQTFVNYVKKSGGVCFSAHPFRNNNRGLKENLDLVRGLDGVEVLNGSTDREANRRAFEYAEKLGIQTVGSSDCHTLDKVGCYATFFPENISCMKELIQAFKGKVLRPAAYVDGKYQIMEAAC